MATVHVDIVGEEALTERNGVVTSLVRLARVSGLSNTDPRVLSAALTACNAASLTVGSALTGYPSNLVLVARDAKATDSPTVVDVTLTYDTTTRGQGLDGLAFGFLLAEITTSLVETSSYFDVDGDPIEVSHVYPTSDPRFGEATLADRTITKGVAVKSLQPQLELRVRYVKATNHPELIALALAGKVNRVAWYGAVARAWLCTGVSVVPQNSGLSPPTFEITAMFQRAATTWDATGVFTDSETGEAPDNVVPGVGTKTVQVHEDVNFESVLEARVYNG